MPDSLWPNEFRICPPPAFIGPGGKRPTLINDQHCVFLVDSDNNFVGFDSNFGRGGRIARLLDASRSSTRNF